MALLLLACAKETSSSRPAPSLSESPSPSPSPTLFDGTIHGWRIAPHEIIDKEGLGRALKLSCTPKEVAAGTKTDLDMSIGYLPAGARATSTTKWVCDNRALSVAYWFNVDNVPEGEGGDLRIERWVMDERAFPIDSFSLVESCTVSNLPAVCVHPEDRSPPAPIVLVIEDDTLDPFATIRLVIGENLSYEEVLKVANAVR